MVIDLDKIKQQRQEKLDKLIERINDDFKWHEDYIRTEESSHAEFLSSFFYGEADTEEIIKEIKAEVFEGTLTSQQESALDKLKAISESDKNRFFTILELNSALSFETIHLTSNEILSQNIGEVEIVFQDETREELKALSPDDFEHVRSQVDGYISDACLGYLDFSYNRWVMYITCANDLITAIEEETL